MNDHSSVTANGSVYESLVGQLRNSILSGEFKSGQFLGSECALSRDKKISRMTVRKASEILINEGLIERRPGKGLYIRGAALRTVQVVAGNFAWESSPRFHVAPRILAVSRAFKSRFMMRMEVWIRIWS